MAPPLLSVDDILALAAPDPDRRFRYGDDPLQFVELRLPPGESPQPERSARRSRVAQRDAVGVGSPRHEEKPPQPERSARQSRAAQRDAMGEGEEKPHGIEQRLHPVAIVLHGGCWRSRYDVAHIGSFSAALAREGIATWTVEYRRVGDPGGGWPGTFLDVARGVDLLQSIALEHALDRERVVAVGHSAGGQLALWLAARGRLPLASEIRGGPDPLRLKGVVSLAGVDDLRRALAEGICDDMASQLLGGGPTDRPERYRDASPIELLPLGTRLHLVNGALDPIVPVAFGEDFERRSRSAGDDVTLTVLPDAGHFELIAPSSGAFATVSDAVASLTACQD